MSEAMMDGLVAYFNARGQQRTQAVRDLMATFSQRELRLIREAAVMGYVQGVQCGPHRDKIPPDSEILLEVLDACTSFPDLYPVITGYREDDTD